MTDTRFQPGTGDDVRAVALAICKSRTCEGGWCCQWPANMGRTNCNAKNGGYDDAARAAIAVLSSDVAVAPREPNNAALLVVRHMVDAYDSGNLKMESPEIGEPENNIPIHPWHEELIWNARQALAALPSEAIGRDQVIAQCAIIALEQRCERGTPWDLACTTIAEKIRALLVSRPNGNTP